MPYATVADVQARMPQFTLTATTRPTLDQAQIFLDDSIAQMEAALSNLGYVIPITGALSIPQVREAVCDRAICRILHARGAAVGTDAAFQSANAACDRYDAFLKALADSDSPIELSDAQRTETAVDKPKNLVMGLVFDDNGDRIEPRIGMNSQTFPMGEF